MNFKRIKVSINERRCIGCGGCMEIAPKYFQLGKRHSLYIGSETVNQDELNSICNCEMFCPARAISIFQFRSS